jgi:hypothetical protein
VPKLSVSQASEHVDPHRRGLPPIAPPARTARSADAGAARGPAMRRAWLAPARLLEP